MIWWILFGVLVCAGFWWDTAHQLNKVKEILRIYLRINEERLNRQELTLQLIEWLEVND